MPRPLFTPGKDPVPIVHEAGWAPGQVWTGAKINNMGMVLTTYPHLPLSLGLCRTVPLFPICAFTAHHRETFL